MTDTPDTPPAEAAFSAWYDATYGADYPNGTEFDADEMWEAFSAGWRAGAARATAAEREACIQLAIHHRAGVRIRHNDDGTITHLNRDDWYPFADLLGGASHDTETRTERTTR